MAEPRPSQNAARLSEDIGDVLSAIRRLIAEDEALTTARDRLSAERGDAATTIDEDAGDFLARRYGGNSALARDLALSRKGDAGYQQPQHLAEAVVRSGDEAEEVWPLGDAANGPDAVRPRVDADRPITRHETPASSADQPDHPAHRNDLVRTLSALTAQAADDQAAVPMIPRLRPIAPTVRPERPNAAAPLRLDATRRVLSGAPSKAEPPRPDCHDMNVAPADEEGGKPATGHEALRVTDLGDDDDFAEAFDWKARMRPELVAQAGVAAPPENVIARIAALGTVEPDYPSQDEALIVLAEALGDGPSFDDVFARGSEADPASGVSNETRESALPTAEQTRQSPVPEDAATAANENQRASAVPQSAEPLARQTITGLSPEEEEQSIRDLLREMIQEELHGELGERFSRNLRSVIRREVAAAIDDQLDRL